MAKILITGGAGFIGSHLAEKLLWKGEEVFVIDDLSTGSRANIRHLEHNKNFHFTEGSILAEHLMAELSQGKEQIYHLAAAVGVRKVLSDPLGSLETNIRGTEIVFREASKNKAKVLLASTSEVCGKNEEMPLREDNDRTYGSIYKTRWLYALSKGVDEYLALAYHKQKGLPVVIVRFFNVIGPRQTGFYGMVVPNFVQQALRGESITVYGDGNQTRCFAYVSDITDALVKLMQAKTAEARVLNLGSDEEISINELASKVNELTKSNSEIVHQPYEEAYPEGFEDFKRRVPDITEVKKIIDFNPRCLEESLVEIIKYQKQQLDNG